MTEVKLSSEAAGGASAAAWVVKAAIDVSRKTVPAQTAEITKCHVIFIDFFKLLTTKKILVAVHNEAIGQSIRALKYQYIYSL